VGEPCPFSERQPKSFGEAVSDWSHHPTVPCQGREIDPAVSWLATEGEPVRGRELPHIHVANSIRMPQHALHAATSRWWAVSLGGPGQRSTEAMTYQQGRASGFTQLAVLTVVCGRSTIGVRRIGAAIGPRRLM